MMAWCNGDKLDQKEAREAYDAWLLQQGKSAEDVLILHFSGRYGAAWLVFDLQGKLTGYFL